MKNNREEELGTIFPEIIRKVKASSKLYDNITYNHIDLKNSMKEDRDNFFEQAIVLSEKLVSEYGCFFLNGFAKGQEEIPQGKVHLGFQNGVVRTNCVDCLDRTNLMQNLISERSFYKQLKICLRMKDHSEIDINSRVMEFFQEMWKNLGDYIALQYGGSKAHRQKNSKAVTKILTSVNRHISNNFWDMQRQKNISLFLGYFQPEKEERDVWAWNVNNIYKPSENLIKNFNEGAYNGNGLKTFIGKLTLESATKVDALSYLISMQHIFNSARPQPFSDILLNNKEYRLKYLLSDPVRLLPINGHNDDPEISEEQKGKTEVVEPFDSFHDKNRIEVQTQLNDLNKFFDEQAFKNYLEAEKLTEHSYKSSQVNDSYQKIKSQSLNKDTFLFSDDDLQGEGLIGPDIMRLYDLSNVKE